MLRFSFRKHLTLCENLLKPSLSAYENVSNFFGAVMYMINRNYTHSEQKRTVKFKNVYHMRKGTSCNYYS